MKQPNAFPPHDLRAAMRSSLPKDTASDVPVQYFYVPRRHTQALDFDSVLVRGIRGSGKSVWWEALQSEQHRKTILRVPSLADLDNSEVSPGFGSATNRPKDYPDKRIIKPILIAHLKEPAIIWRTIIAWHTWGKNGALAQLETWKKRVDWVANHPEEVAHHFSERDEQLYEDSQRHIVLFDALDLAADDWEHLILLLRGLLECLLEFRSYKSIRAKAFVRHDMLVPEATRFPDASKLLANAAELTWQPLDLYGLLWQYLGNSPDESKTFREASEQISGEQWKLRGGVWIPPLVLRRDERIQREVFHAIAGPWMGRDPRRGFPYTWLPNHLGDALGQVSPRSFLAAVRAAAEDDRYDSHPYALHYEAIKRGVQQASSIRVEEVEDSFSWVGHAMAPLDGLVIPCHFKEIENRWKKIDTLEVIRKNSESPGTSLTSRLPPRRLEEGLQGLRKELVELGMFQEMPEGRINMPDVYRVGFGLGRRGGVKPVR
jgi:hypothetical protein